ncbi:PAS domain S-box protein [Motiliproteus coralliicola]|uniref:PAS domain S-box protein n=1 Tax=Motiliproteus coralliicola TaxID=2283196 RepID=A0A369WUY0_9GAMM|nr:PAS domain-containing methyl-accepting chemotaxis protein [Motiliproteus coralliicola]RDE24933.1 PAS domain S-box protein [Motiliproteus coralliicola]
MKINLPVTNKEVRLREDQTIISMTDLKGAVTYVNQDFIDISGFSEAELMGVNHNIVRHPDMPPAAYKNLWDTIKAGQAWRGIVKNRCKNGDHYWVEAFVTPVMKNNQVIGYQSVRSKPSQQQIDSASALYKKINDQKLTELPQTRSFKLRISQQFSIIQSLWFALLLLATASQLFFNIDSASLLYGLIGAGALLYLAGFAWVRTQVISPLRSLARSTKDLANGNLNTRITVDKPGALGESQLGLDMIRARLKTVIGRIQESSSGMVVSTEQLSAMCSESDQRMQIQMMETEQLATAMHEMTATVAEVATSTTVAAESAQDAMSRSNSGSAVVDTVKSTISSLSGDIERIEEEINELHQDSQNIGSILEVIRGVAEQTNLLALNAAIEAARAGEQGRGFAVVADEVRGLAQRVQDSTNDIDQMISQLQDKTKRSVEMMTHSRERAALSVDHANDAEDALEGIRHSITMIHDLSTQIATAAEEQAAVSEEMNRNVIKIKDQSIETNSATQQASSGCAELFETSKRLDLLSRDYDV